LSRMTERLRSAFAKRGALTWYIEIFTGFLPEMGSNPHSRVRKPGVRR
jgi:hypothetical protein